MAKVAKVELEAWKMWMEVLMLQTITSRMNQTIILSTLECSTIQTRKTKQTQRMRI